MQPELDLRVSARPHAVLEDTVQQRARELRGPAVEREVARREGAEPRETIEEPVHGSGERVAGCVGARVGREAELCGRALAGGHDDLDGRRLVVAGMPGEDVGKVAVDTRCRVFSAMSMQQSVVRVLDVERQRVVLALVQTRSELEMRQHERVSIVSGDVLAREYGMVKTEPKLDVCGLDAAANGKLKFLRGGIFLEDGGMAAEDRESLASR